ncbi:hypothetical protein DM01DRAFT_1338141 [Hesseltinella vesiculosa]|uniref:RlpA-like protein double-psi beta-barrel domain-containing protein n=1 Tax=Hesseltinella vesiculosa TaxID=101127 RepID=A0A1X2GAW5_9FUNG|nr:hypothetical protein DM01DRAFT_1338141 [Hesseltinella vesiculosa]
MKFSAGLITLTLTTLLAVQAAPIEKRNTGKATYYNTGLGSCGETNNDNELVVALSAADMSKSYCGKSIKVTSGSKSVTATVVDTCPGCASGSIDLSPAAFKKLANLAVGVISPVSWTFA